ncbi:hypothetical protein cypCar_00036183 [Cyprinus carpio]|nr:hypothetical protein cypCar_00036183 [Cyprinus carpio]
MCKENVWSLLAIIKANERIKEARPNQVAEKVAARISENSGACNDHCWINSRFTDDCFVLFASFYDHHDNKWKQRANNIDAWCKENKYVIAGYYQANERIKEARPNQVAEKVAARISENFSEAAMIMLDNSRFTMDCFVPVLFIYDHHDNKWKCREPSTDCFEDWIEAQKITAALLESKSYESLVDFDNHLDDLRNDWTNPEINKSVLHLC